MKIEIEITDSITAEIKIGDRRVKYGARKGMWQFIEGVSEQELENTIEGIVLLKLTNVLSDIMQGYLPDEQNADDCCWEPWEKLSRKAQEEVYNRINP